MSQPAPVENPYVAPPAERYSPKLKKNERDLLLGLLELREPPPLGRLLSRALASSGWTLPFAAAFGILFALASFFAFGLSNESTAWIGGGAFAAALAGSFFRDLVDAMNTQTLREVLSRITDFGEVERILYDRPTLSPLRASSDEPLAAIPVEDDPPPPALEGDAVARR